MATHPELPDELQAKPKPAMSEGERAEKLLALGKLIAGKRDEAVSARKESGIEEVWLSAEDAYQGIDDTNRHEFSKAKWTKSSSMQGPLTANSTASPNKSTAYVRLTTRYVDMAAAKISEIVLPIDDKAFTFDDTPVPDPINPQAAQVQQAPAVAPAVPGAMPGQPTPIAQAVSEVLTPAKKAEQRIYDWMVESRYPMQMRKVIHDSARIGVGIIKGPYPELTTAKAFSTESGQGELKIVSKVCPAWKWTDPWNFFPHGSCGEDVHEGDHVFERDYLSATSLKKLKEIADQLGVPTYLPDQIDKVLTEGPGKCNLEQGRNPNDPERKTRFEIWHFTGTLNREDMVALDAPGADELPDEVIDCYCMLTLVNDTIIRATFNPLEKSGNFPYRVFSWTRRAGHWAGVGVGEQIGLPQRMVNAGTRGWMNNAGKTSGSQFVMDQRAIKPADGNWDITPDKLWFLTGEGVSDDIRKMFLSIEIPDRAQTLQAVIQYAFKLAEELSNIPLVSQGQTGKEDPQTFGQAELQNTNAHTLLRDKAYTLDDCVTEPTVNDAYEWLLLDPDVPDDEKGNFQINARGSIAMVEKSIQLQMLGGMLQLSLNPVWGQNPKKVMAQFLRGYRMNPETTAYTPEELAKIQTPPPPQVQVAQINANAKIQTAQMNNQAELQQVAAEAQNEQNMLLNGGTTPHTAMAMARVEQERIRATTAQTVEASRAFAERERAQKEFEIARQNGEFKIQEMQLQKDIALLQYATQEKISLDAVKAQLANTAMNNQTKRELAAAEIQLAQSEGAQDRAVDLHKHNTSLVRDEMATDNTP